jgi:hypothetical protein
LAASGEFRRFVDMTAMFRVEQSQEMPYKCRENFPEFLQANSTAAFHETPPR